MRKFFLASALVFAYCSAHAQIHLGAKAGANMTKIDGKSFSEKYKLGYQLGGYAYYDFSKMIGLQLEVQFNQSNTQISDRYSDVLFDSFGRGKKLNYITIPVLFRINSQGALTFLAGPQFSFITDSDKNILENGTKLFRSSDIGLVGGVDLNIRPFIISARYVWGLNDISGTENKATGRQIQLGLGFEIF
ncbi:porin family protein [Chryseobacterium salviniae]|uniref:Porin family protein n=1 Tax=Chryseobacterium salviniae TaxID=3101750 RepID=A0ABU6HQZ3_9FLAO|nr:porin family protein [Chryseobacterium sp. T9W2-O]MEC3875328.1 porin family protein [Chryseobacterium sp. T9W2-O]